MTSRVRFAGLWALVLLAAAPVLADEDPAQVGKVLDELEPERPLAGDDRRIGEGRTERHPAVLGQAERVQRHGSDQDLGGGRR